MEKLHEVNCALQINTQNGQYSEDLTKRYILTASWSSSYCKKAVAIGINPSIANDIRSDNTITKLSRFLDMYGFCEFKMLNLFTSYSTLQKGIISSTTTDFDNFNTTLEAADIILIVWGVSNDFRDQKENVLITLQKFKHKIYCIQKPNGASPMHPSRLSYKYQLKEFE